MRSDVSADAAAHGEPDDRARPGSDLRADRRADAVALRCADQQTVLHSDGCPERTAEPAAFFEADVRTDDHTYAVSLCRANEVERAPLNIVCLVSPPYPYQSWYSIPTTLENEGTCRRYSSTYGRVT